MNGMSEMFLKYFLSCFFYNYNFSSSQIYPYLTFGRIFGLYITKSPITGEFRNQLNITKFLEL